MRGLAAAARARRARSRSGFVLYWTAVAACAGFVGASEIIYNYVVHDDARPSAGGPGRSSGSSCRACSVERLITVCFMHLSAALVPLLPGLWAICFGIGTFASRPYLPRASGWVALFYYAAGFALLWIAGGRGPLSGWWVGGTFGTGQLLGGSGPVVEPRKRRRSGNTMREEEADAARRTGTLRLRGARPRAARKGAPRES